MDDDIDEIAVLLTQCLPGEVLIQGQLFDSLYEDDAGQLHVYPDAGQWTDITVADAGICEHEETICAHCVESWSHDWYLRAIAI